MKRRRFVGTLAAGAGLSALPLAAARTGARRLRVLVLGGTNYVGPHVVEAALERGHEVTIFNRGFHNPELFPTIGHLRGDRFRDRGAGLRALEGDREWDLVVDTWAAEPGCVHDTARLLAGRTGRYLYVSSIAVLGSFRRTGLDEDAPTVDAAAHVDSFDPELGYPHAKRAGELAVLNAFGDRGTVLRCSAIWGHDPYGAQLSYWGVRFLSGEPFLVPRTEPVPLWDVLRTWDAVVGGRSGMVPGRARSLMATGSGRGSTSRTTSPTTTRSPASTASPPIAPTPPASRSAPWPPRSPTRPGPARPTCRPRSPAAARWTGGGSCGWWPNSGRSRHGFTPVEAGPQSVSRRQEST